MAMNCVVREVFLRHRQGCLPAQPQPEPRSRLACYLQRCVRDKLLKQTHTSAVHFTLARRSQVKRCVVNMIFVTRLEWVLA